MQFKKTLIFLFFFFVLGLQVIIKSGTISPLLFQVLFNSNNIELKKETPETINLLLLGIGGGNHDCPNCSDTIIFANLNLASKKVTLVSLPRDIWVTDLKGKVNSAYSNGESKRKGGGLILAKSVIGKITGQNIDYGIVIDFSGFVKAVDLMGGVDVIVDKTFDDYQYPIEGNENDLCGHSDNEVKAFSATDSASVTFDLDQAQFFPCRYEHVHFDKGLAHMDGETALKFVRSRHAAGSEGTDFARSNRQEEVIKALMNKAFSLQIIANPTKVIALYNNLKSSIKTDISDNEIDDFIKLAQKFQHAQIQSAVIDYGDPVTKRPGLLINPPIGSKFNYEWVLVPRAGDNNFSEIHSYIMCKLTKFNCVISPTPTL